MSLNYIRHGRYSREKKQVTCERIAEVTEKKNMMMCSIPALPNFTDADEILMGCCNIISDIQNIDWEKDFPHLDSLLQAAKEGINSISYPLEQYHDIFCLSGLEVDNRRQFSGSVQQIIEYNVKRWTKYSRKIPGLHDLSEDEIFSHLCSHSDLIYVTIVAFNIHRWSKEDLTLTLNNQSILVSRRSIDYLLDKRDSKMKMNIFEKFSTLNPTFEELTLIILLTLLKPNDKYPQFQHYYDKIILGFTRYLQNIHGNNFIGRMNDIVNFLSFMSMETYNAGKWRPTVKDYYTTIFAGDIMKEFWFHPTISKPEVSINDLSLLTNDLILLDEYLDESMCLD
ncbi:unnamed protein product [Dimorphilus gyrociliatus]|nr:unnamed protein product [Dimorphilus gyrociliatus]